MVIGIWRLFQGPIQSSSSSDCVWSLWNSKVSLMFLLSTVDSCSAGLFSLLSTDFTAVLSVTTGQGAKVTRVGRFLIFSVEKGPFDNVFKGTFSSCVTANLSNFLKCLPSRTGEVTFKLSVKQVRRVRTTEPFWAMYILPLMLLWILGLGRRCLWHSGALSSPVELVSYSGSTTNLIILFLAHCQKRKIIIIKEIKYTKVTKPLKCTAMIFRNYQR